MDEASPKARTRIRFEIAPWFKRAIKRGAIAHDTTMKNYWKMAVEAALEKDGIPITEQRDSYGAS